MDTHAAMRTFLQVVDSGGFAAAGRQLGRATSSVSRQIGELEGALGVRLFHRTTRRLSLTEAGQTYYQRAVGILDAIEEAHRAVADLDGEPSGVLRVTAATGMEREVISLALPDYLARYPRVRVVLSVTDAILDLVAERIDLAIRGGRQRDSSLVARKISDSPRVVCASPAYLARAGAPTRPTDLRAHNCLTFRAHPGRNTWTFRGPDGLEEVAVSGNLFVRSGDALAAAAVGGLGLALLPDWLIGAELRTHRLVPVLTDYQVLPWASPVYAVYPPSPYVPPKVRAFIDVLRTHLQGEAAMRGEG